MKTDNSMESVYMVLDAHTNTLVDVRDLTPMERRAWRTAAAHIDPQTVAVIDLVNAGGEEPIWVGCETTNAWINHLALLMGDVVQWGEAEIMYELLQDNGHIIRGWLVCEHQTWENHVIEAWERFEATQVNQ